MVLKDVLEDVVLGDIVQSRAGKTPSRSDSSYWGGQVPWVTAKDLKTHRLSSSLECITSKAVKDGAPLASVGDVLILVRGMTLLKDVPLGVVAAPVSYNQDVRCLRPLAGHSGEYIAYLLLAAKDRLLSTVTQAGHGTGRLDGEQLMSVPLRVPPANVQMWLVQRLQHCDRMNVTLDRLLAAKRELKRGLMQELLTGRRRAPEFHRNRWESVRLGDVFRERNEKGHPHLRLLAVTGDRGVIPRDWLDRRDTSNEDKSLYKRVCPGDIAYNTMRMWQGVCGLSEYEGIVSPAYTVVTPSERILGAFARHLFKLPRVIYAFWRHSQGLVDDTLSLKFPNFAKVRVSIPTSLDEQATIARVLDLIERETELLEIQRDEFELQKRGLLQKLLTGEVEILTDKPDAAYA